MLVVNNPKSFVYLDSTDLEHLAITIEGAVGVRNPAQFYLWTQGALQGFLPHEALLCAHGNIANMKLCIETIGRTVLPPRVVSAVSDPANGILMRMIDDWLRSDAEPRCFSQGGQGHTGRRQLIADLKKCEFDNVIGHGVMDPSDGQGGFFALVGMPNTPGPREFYLLELLMPHLHFAWKRSLASPQSSTANRSVLPGTLLTKREIQVLHWVKNGKTNPEIGQILGISALTAKNHVRKIMRKLQVSNRAQAVGKGDTLRLVVRGDTH